MFQAKIILFLPLITRVPCAGYACNSFSFAIDANVEMCFGQTSKSGCLVNNNTPETFRLRERSILYQYDVMNCVLKSGQHLLCFR